MALDLEINTNFILRKFIIILVNGFFTSICFIIAAILLQVPIEEGRKKQLALIQLCALLVTIPESRFQKGVIVMPRLMSFIILPFGYHTFIGRIFLPFRSSKLVPAAGHAMLV